MESLEDSIVNKVAQSGLITINLEDFYPRDKRVQLDISPWLYESQILRENEFRRFIAEHNWSVYDNAFVAVHCSADAIIPQWAWVLIANRLVPHAKRTVFGTLEQLDSLLFESIIKDLPLEEYQDKKVIIKGCSKFPVPIHAFIALTEKLSPVVKSLMYGEACSTVPIYKGKK